MLESHGLAVHTGAWSEPQAWEVLGSVSSITETRLTDRDWYSRSFSSLVTPVNEQRAFNRFCAYWLHAMHMLRSGLLLHRPHQPTGRLELLAFSSKFWFQNSNCMFICDEASCHTVGVFHNQQKIYGWRSSWCSNNPDPKHTNPAAPMFVRPHWSELGKLT